MHQRSRLKGRTRVASYTIIATTFFVPKAPNSAGKGRVEYRWPFTSLARSTLLPRVTRYKVGGTFDGKNRPPCRLPVTTGLLRTLDENLNRYRAIHTVRPFPRALRDLRFDLSLRNGLSPDNRGSNQCSERSDHRSGVSNEDDPVKTAPVARNILACRAIPVQ